jgi:hypothetical protein
LAALTLFDTDYRIAQRRVKLIWQTICPHQAAPGAANNWPEILSMLKAKVSSIRFDPDLNLILPLIFCHLFEY